MRTTAPLRPEEFLEFRSERELRPC
ncbi:MAG: hypothetical protein H6Q86_5678, partial [candidate division NC10 bacterium]|nr:hypothetical protein [candidate division NC10 bacterium]